jgi:hypothetical protein
MTPAAANGCLAATAHYVRKLHGQRCTAEHQTWTGESSTGARPVTPRRGPGLFPSCRSQVKSGAAAASMNMYPQGFAAMNRSISRTSHPRPVNAATLTAEKIGAGSFWSYGLLDRTVFGRQEPWEDSPDGWPQIPAGQHQWRVDGRPLAQWSSACKDLDPAGNLPDRIDARQMTLRVQNNLYQSGYTLPLPGLGLCHIGGSLMRGTLAQVTSTVGWPVSGKVRVSGKDHQGQERESAVDGPLLA